MTTKKGSGVKSPGTPSYALETSIANTSVLYKRYSHGKFTKPEIASALGMSSKSSNFVQKVFAMAEYQLIIKDGDDYQVTDQFHTLSSNEKNSPSFKQTAYQSICGSEIFGKILEEFPGKLPDQSTVSQRLETKYRFTENKAKDTAKVLEKSLKFAGVLDDKNNILPIREDLINKPGHPDIPDELPEDPGTTSHKTEIPLADERIVVVYYPHDITTNEAEKVSSVLKALSL